jgi:hypothetical protein
MSEFWLGVIAMAAVGLVIGMLVIIHTLDNERERELSECRDKSGVLVAEVHGHYACISTGALYTWHKQ